MLVVLFSFFAVSLAGTNVASVYFTDGAYRLTDTYDKSATCWATFEDTLFVTGLGKLWVYTNPEADDTVQMHCAGLVEGALTAMHIYNHRSNVLLFEANHFLNTSDLPPEVLQFVEDNRAYIVRQVAAYPDDPFWRYIGLLYAQFEGLVEGYALRHPTGKDLTIADLWLYEASNDLMDVFDALEPAGYKRVVARHSDLGYDHCTALVKLLPDKSEIYVAHTAWFFYGATNRILKSYNLPLRDSALAAKQLVMSSYPGLLFSFDDFVMASSNIVAIETALPQNNKDLWAHVKPQSVLRWMRSMVAARLAKSGEQWTAIFARENSGTNNDHALVVDFNLFSPGKELPAGTLWAAEQYPGGVVRKDVTETLAREYYYPSYNMPLFPEVYELVNMTAQAQTPSGYFWSDRLHSARANILRRDHANVVNLDTMKALIRENHYDKDPFSINPGTNISEPCAAIAARGDLCLPGQNCRGGPIGGIDGKVTSSRMAKVLTMAAVNGPTPDQKPLFKFSNPQSYPQPHEGVPDEFGSFDWELMTATENSGIRLAMLIWLIVGASGLTVGISSCLCVWLVQRRRARRISNYGPLPISEDLYH